MEKVKQLLLDGQAGAALELYCQLTGASPEAAREALADLGQKLSLDVVRQQQLTPAGIGIVIIYALVALSGLGLWASGRVHWLVGLVLFFLGAWMVYFYYPALAATLRFRRGKPARAEVINLAEVGVTRLGKQRVRVFALLVEVHPEDCSPPYKAEMRLPVREQNVMRAQPGTSIRVKYLPDQPEKIIYQD